MNISSSNTDIDISHGWKPRPELLHHCLGYRADGISCQFAGSRIPVAVSHTVAYVLIPLVEVIDITIYSISLIISIMAISFVLVLLSTSTPITASITII